MGCCGDCVTVISKIVLVTINTIFWLASALMLAFGIAGKANPNSVQTIFDYLIPASERSYLQGIGVDLTSIVVANSIFMIIVGVVGLVISTIGFVGACCTVRWLLVTYAVLMILLLLAEIALIIFAAVWANNFQQLFQSAMNQTIATQFDADISVNASGFYSLPTSVTALSWASVQLQTKCCGAYNYSDYMTASAWTNRTAVPLSCCTQTNASNPATMQYQFVDMVSCLAGNSQFINSQNCYQTVNKDIQNFIQSYKGIAIGIAAGIAGLELILIVMAFLLCCRHKDNDNYV